MLCLRNRVRTSPCELPHHRYLGYFTVFCGTFTEICRFSTEFRLPKDRSKRIRLLIKSMATSEVKWESTIDSIIATMRLPDSR